MKPSPTTSSRHQGAPRKATAADRKPEEARPILPSAPSDAELAELQQHYRFLPNPTSSQGSTWQERMVQRYHDHLYKQVVLADLTRANQQQIGLRWRTQAEVERGKGTKTCGNKHCPSHEQKAQPPQHHFTLQSSSKRDHQTALGRSSHKQPPASDPTTEAFWQLYWQRPLPTDERTERERLEHLPYGTFLHSFEVPFTYVEEDQSRTELVQLRLCLRCAPLLFLAQGRARDPHQALRASLQQEEEEEETADSHPNDQAKDQGGQECGARKTHRISADDRRSRKR